MSNRVLIVEDEFLIRLVLADALSDAGYQVDQASTGDEAAAFAATSPQLALMVTDIHMPGKLDGHALARNLREIYPNLPIVYTSGRPDPARASGARASALPAHDPETQESVTNEVFIDKPYTPKQVITAIEKLLAPKTWSGREDSNLRP